MPFKLGGGQVKKGEGKKASAPKAAAVEAAPSKPEESKGPITRAFSIEQRSTKWVLHRYTIQDGKVLSDNPSEPEGKSLCTERFKIEFAKAFLFGEATKPVKRKQ